MVLVTGLWTLLRALLGAAMAVALENAALRHQLAVLQRSGRRPQLHRWDRTFWVCLSRLWSNWRCSLVIVQPATVIAWHPRPRAVHPPGLGSIVPIPLVAGLHHRYQRAA